MRAVSIKACVMLACLVPPTVAAAQGGGVPRVLIDRRLQERQVLVTGIDDQALLYLDSAGLTRTEPVADLLALLPPPGEIAPGDEAAGPDDPEGDPQNTRAPAAMLELTDGQRFAGALSLAIVPADGETLRWIHPALGLLEFKLDQVHRVRLGAPPEAPAGPAPQDDVVLLSNGDRLTGFVESLGQTLRFSTGEGQSAEIPLDRVRDLVLANPAEPPPPKSIMAYFRDGSVIACRALRTSRTGELMLVRRLQESESPDPRRTEAAQPSLRIEDLVAAAFDPPALSPLAALEPARQEPLGGRRWTRPASAIDPYRTVLGAADISLPGPMSVEWDLPAGAGRILARAELPRQNWTWGDCELVVSVVPAAGDAAPGQESELARRRLSAEQPAVSVAAPLPDRPWPRRLRVRLEPGRHGPIQDQVVLRRPLLLVGPGPN